MWKTSAQNAQGRYQTANFESKQKVSNPSFKQIMTSTGVYFPSNLSIHLYSQVLGGSPLCDVLIEVADRRIHCHAAVVACASEIFRELLELAPTENSGKKVISFSTACSESMYCVLNYIYTGAEVIYLTRPRIFILRACLIKLTLLFRPSTQETWPKFSIRHF